MNCHDKQMNEYFANIFFSLNRNINMLYVHSCISQTEYKYMYLIRLLISSIFKHNISSAFSEFTSFFKTQNVLILIPHQTAFRQTV